MIFKKTVLVIALTSLLAACGGGGGDSSTSSGSPNGGSESTNTMSDLDKAKQLITTANTIISYYDSFEDIQKTYEPSIDAVAQVSTDIEDGSNLVLILAELAHDDAKGSNRDYNSEQVAALYNTHADYTPDYKLSNNTLSIQVRGSTITIRGSTEFERWVGYNFPNNGQSPTPIYADKMTMDVKDLVLTVPVTNTSATSYRFNLQQGGSIHTINAKQKEATLSFNGNSTASITYASSKIMDVRTDDEVPTSAKLELSNITLKTNDNFVATLAELSGEAKAANFINNGDAFVGLVPYQVKLKGTATLNDKDNLGIDATIKLNNDLTKNIDITGNKESLNNFLNLSVEVALKGNLQAKAKQTPFSLKIDALRNKYESGNATADIDVDGNALNIQFISSDLDKDKPTIGATIKHKNGAFVSTPNLKNFASTDIMVGSQSYGTLSKTSGSVYNAKFSDNSIITIAP
ncbi:hypothetical protein [Acinetobacter ihumii]|uniref:hypothetical protein n=1 Tax=Acinetobacter ihumii TaxID=2483802 RepID=UPI00102FF245|nr:hypothetical protein [Acinetobacter ihumii]